MVTYCFNGFVCLSESLFGSKLWKVKGGIIPGSICCSVFGWWPWNAGIIYVKYMLLCWASCLSWILNLTESITQIPRMPFHGLITLILPEYFESLNFSCMNIFLLVMLALILLNQYDCFICLHGYVLYRYLVISVIKNIRNPYPRKMESGNPHKYCQICPPILKFSKSAVLLCPLCSSVLITYDQHLYF